MKTLMHPVVAMFAGMCMMCCCFPKDNPKKKSLKWTYGKNEYNEVIDDSLRNFFIHVPKTYTGDESVPFVFMLHGSSGTGEEFYRRSTWVEKADQEGFIVVFPTGLSYFIVEKQRYSTKWSSDGLAKDIPPGTIIKDDIPFFKKMIERCENTFNLDRRRYYITGFSNGGGFIRSRIVPEMPDVFAAAATGGGVGLSTTYPVKDSIYLPLFTMIGTQDAAIIEASGISGELPIEADEFMKRSDLRGQVNNILATLQLDTIYTEKSNQPIYNLITFKKDFSGQKNEYKIMIINDMGHSYPNANNNPHNLIAADIIWPWFNKFSTRTR